MIRTPAVLTLLHAAGLDFARVDMEHSPFSMETDALTIGPTDLAQDLGVLRSSYAAVADDIRRTLPARG